MLSYADITERKRAEREVARKEAQLHVALDNMPGALAYTDDEPEHRRLQQSLHRNVSGAEGAASRRDGPYPDLLRHLASNGYYGEGDVEALVAQRVRKPAQSGRAIRSRTARRTAAVYEVNRRKAAQGGTVTVITDITRPQARRGGAVAQGGASSTSRSTTCRARSPTPTPT